LIALIRDALSIELRTPSAMLGPAQVDAVRRYAHSKNSDASSPERVRLQIASDVAMEMCVIHAGTFAMGSPPSEEGHNDDEVVHDVTISESFYLASTPVTQRQFEPVVGHNPSYFVGPDLPVEMVSWFDCATFCEILGERLGRRLRLPTEAEWEYACRAGSTTAYNLGASITTAQANFDGWFVKPHVGESRKQTSPAGAFEANAWGLFDMHGNVWEWCEDWYGDYASGAVTDPQGPSDGEIRILRGGSWFHGPADARSAQRDALDPGRRHSIYGFRVAMSCL
jgi:formylglycine-generating enzyme required for sulfatase activity